MDVTKTFKFMGFWRPVARLPSFFAVARLPSDPFLPWLLLIGFWAPVAQLPSFLAGPPAGLAEESLGGLLRVEAAGEASARAPTAIAWPALLVYLLRLISGN